MAIEKKLVAKGLDELMESSLSNEKYVRVQMTHFRTRLADGEQAPPPQKIQVRILHKHPCNLGYTYHGETDRGVAVIVDGMHITFLDTNETYEDFEVLAGEDQIENILRYHETTPELSFDELQADFTDSTDLTF